jgi:hypothetical protein
MVPGLAQETFLRVFRDLPGFVAAGPARLSTWIGAERAHDLRASGDGWKSRATWGSCRD